MKYGQCVYIVRSLVDYTSFVLLSIDITITVFMKSLNIVRGDIQLGMNSAVFVLSHP